MTTPWIRTPEALAELAGSLEGCRAMALDTESDSLYHHFEKVCLVQIATDRGQAVLVDALAVRDLSPLAPAMADPGLVKVLHGADYDVTTLKRDFGFSFASLFDTMIAARFLGRSEIGLAAVARDELGVALNKDNQKDDWSRRPLTPQQETYALADVLHLVELRERLSAKLAAAGRLEWLRGGVRGGGRGSSPRPASATPRPTSGSRGPGACRRGPSRRCASCTPGASAGRRRRTLPPFKILGNESLLRLAELRPKDAAGLGAVPGVLPRLQRQAGELLGARPPGGGPAGERAAEGHPLASTRGRRTPCASGSIGSRPFACARERSCSSTSRSSSPSASSTAWPRPAPATRRGWPWWRGSGAGGSRHSARSCWPPYHRPP